MPLIPKEKEYLRHYFKTDPEKAFVPYWICFFSLYVDKGEDFFYNCYMDHTGYVIRKTTLLRFILKLDRLESLYKKALEEMNLELVRRINLGQLTKQEYEAISNNSSGTPQ